MFHHSSFSQASFSPISWRFGDFDQVVFLVDPRRQILVYADARDMTILLEATGMVVERTPRRPYG